MRKWFRRLAYLLRQSRHDADLREEIEAHRAHRAAHLERDGLTPHEADTASRRAIGNVLLAREDVREVWLGSWGTWWQDVRYGLRTLRKNPAFTAVAMITLALGIGVNTGIFVVVNGVLFRDLPVPGARAIVAIQQTVEGGDVMATTGFGTFSTPEYRAYRDRARTLAGVVAHSNPQETTLGGNTPQQMFGVLVSCNYFTVLQQAPIIGRALTEGDCAPGAAPVVVLGHELWTRSFAAEPGVVGRTIELNRQFFTVVGVAGRDVYGPAAMRPQYFAPISADPLLSRTPARYEDENFRWLYLIGRRGDSVGFDQVRAELAVIAAQIDQQQPGRSTVLTIGRATPMTVPTDVRGAATAAAAVLMAAFGLVLLIACANVANLLLARGAARTQETAIRVSLGASRARVVRQLLTESLLIAIAGGVLGSVVAMWSFQALVGLALPAVMPPEMPTFTWGLDLSPDYRALLFAMALTLGTGLLFGLAPALHASRPDLQVVLKQDTAGTGSRRGDRLRATLVGVQVGLSMVLMLATGLLVRGLYATHTIDPGFVYRDISYISFGLDGMRAEPGAARLLLQRLRDSVSSLPGVEAVELASDPPLGEEIALMEIHLPGWSGNEFRTAQLNAVTPGYFSLIGLPIVRGRTFTEAEFARARPDADDIPVVITETTARNLWGNADPIGRTIDRGDFVTKKIVGSLQVVGVVADAQVSTLGRIDPYFVYVPGGEELLLRSRADFSATVSGIQAIVRRLDPALVIRVLPLEANLAFWRGMSGMVTTLGAGLGVLALVLAAVGIYGVVSYAVTRRYREMGIRIALGASAGDVLGLILRQTMRPVVIGAATGIVAAIGVSRILSSVLFGVSPADPIGLGGAALLVAGVALAAGVMAARPATRTDPTVTLRGA
jgi:predicted permease